MALNIPMPDLSGTSLLKGLDTGSSMFSRLIQPVIERERLKQQQDQFVQNLALQKETEGRAQTLLPYLIQQYQDTHTTAANEAKLKELYLNIINGAVTGPSNSTTNSTLFGGSSGMPTDQPASAPTVTMAPTTNPSNGAPSLPQLGTLPTTLPQPQEVAPDTSTPSMIQEQEVRAGNPQLYKLDKVAGLIPGIPKPVQHIVNGTIFTTYPSGRMTAQQVKGVQTPGEKNVSAKEASKIRDQASSLINSANLVQQGYDLLDQNPNLTGPGNIISAIPIPFTGGGRLNLSSNPEVGNFTTVAGRLQAELGKYAASRGGIQAVKWAGSVKPSAFNSPDYNYGMFNGTKRNIMDEYNTLNAQYKSVTGQDLPVKLPNMATKNDKNKNTSNGTNNKIPPKTETGGFDPKTILDYKYKDKDEFINTFNTLNDESKAIVRAEMKKRGWH